MRGAIGADALALEDLQDVGGDEDEGGMSVEEFGKYIEGLRQKRKARRDGR